MLTCGNCGFADESEDAFEEDVDPETGENIPVCPECGSRDVGAEDEDEDFDDDLDDDGDDEEGDERDDWDDDGEDDDWNEDDDDRW
jgi:segregation and condensation protein B